MFDENFDVCHQTLADEGYDYFIFTPHGGKALHEVQLQKRSAFVFGNEEQCWRLDFTLS